MTTDSASTAKTHPEDSDAGAHGGSGAYSILGYEYQIDVSVWLALDLVLANKLTQELTLEPATEEDLEADLAEHEPGRVTTEASFGEYRLVVQAKRRSGDAWTVRGLSALLQHGKKRQSAAQRLEKSDVRYLLVTSAALNGGTRDLKVRRAGSWPPAEDLPVTIQRALPAGAAGRVAVIGNQDEERLETDIQRLLMESFRIPHPRLTECRQALRSEARARIGGAGGGRWARTELEEVIRHHGGYIASSPELDQFVQPINWPELHATLRRRNAVFIVGQSGTGKTMATRKLYEELREIIPGLTRVRITHGPQQLNDDNTEWPVLYDIEDPWGKYDFDPKSRPWNDQLPRFFSEARHDRLFVATSRLDVAQTTGALDAVRPWIVNLEAEHYRKKERQLLYRTRIEALPRNLQGFAKRSETKVLSELATPLEIQKFFDALPTIDLDNQRSPSALLSEALRQAHQNSIEQTVVDQIEGRQDVVAATIIWGLMKAHEKLSIGLLRQVEELLAEFGGQYEQGVSPLLGFFVAARNLRQVESVVTYYHPRVEAGIEKALCRDRLVVKRTLRDLIEVLVAPDGPGQDWGARASARLLLATDRTPDFRPRPSRASQQKIDAWLAIEVAKGGKEFETNLKLSASAGSTDSEISEVARFLYHRPDQRFGYFDIWVAPERDEAWYTKMRGNTGVRPLLAQFVQDILPDSREYYGREFVPSVELLAPDLTTSFLAAAEKAVYYGVSSNENVIAEGALKDILSFEKIIDIAVAVRTPNEADIIATAKTQLAIENGEYNAEYVEHISENDEGWTAGEFLDSYVLHVRKVQGWQKIAEHRHRQAMLFYWLRAIAHEESPGSEEIAGAFSAAFGTEHEDSLWHILAKSRSPICFQKLTERLITGHGEQPVRLAALFCLIKREPAQIAHLSQALFRDGHLGRFVELAIDLGQLHLQYSDESADGEFIDAPTLAANTPTEFQEICLAALTLEKEASPHLSASAIDLLKRLTELSETVRVFRLNVARYLPVFIADDVRWLLSHAPGRDNAVVAIKMAIRHGMIEEIRAGLSHRFAHVVALALGAVGSEMASPLPKEILALSHLEGNPVRSALVALLDAKPHRNHLATLMVLAHDQWSRHYARYGETADYPIAKAAVAAMAKLGHIDSPNADELYRLGIDTLDPGLRYEVFVLLLRSASTDFQVQLFELATSPGQISHRVAAAHALLIANAHILPETIANITPQLLKTRVEAVASRLLLLLSLQGAMDELLTAARALATHRKRRVLLLLSIWVVRERMPLAAMQIASMLPANHQGVSWALGGAQEVIREELLDDLGEASCVEQVLSFMQPTTTQDA